MTRLAHIVDGGPPDRRVTYGRVAAHLRDQPDRGVGEALTYYREAATAEDAHFAADYLGVLPDLRDEKRELVEFALEERPELLEAVGLPLRGVPPETAERVLERHLDAPTDETGTAAYDAVSMFPDALRSYRDRLEDDELSQALLAGAPDDVVEQLEAEYREDPDPDTLRALARVHTDRAVEALLTLAKAAPSDEQETFEAYIESSGVFPDTRQASVWFDVRLGFIVRRDAAPHAVGPGFAGPRPACPECDTPATRVLTLARDALPFDLRKDPSFFWFSCGHEPIRFVYVDLSGETPEPLMLLATTDEPETPLLPAASLALEPHPNQHGIGTDVTSGFALHQVGGFPPWIKLDRHPHCPECSTAMRFLAALDSGPSELGPLELRGILYGFWCDECAISCTLRQGDELY